MSGILYVVATPIGNLNDLTYRAGKVLEEADFIAAEDTRVSLKLLNHLGLKKTMVSYHQHNLAQQGEWLIARILAGETCALCCDAGTPAISDPGQVLVRQAHQAGIQVVPIPGPSAFVAALSAGGQNTGRFVFEGFLSTNRRQRAIRLDELKHETRTMVFYEAPHKMATTAKDLLQCFGADRSVTVARELTKLHEEIFMSTLGELVQRYPAGEKVKGEFVLLVAGAAEPLAPAFDFDDALQQVLRLASKDMKLAAACKEVAAATGFGKNELYAAIMAAKQEETQ